MLQVGQELFAGLRETLSRPAEEIFPGGVTPDEPPTSHGAGFIDQSAHEPRVDAQVHGLRALLACGGDGVCVYGDAATAIEGRC